MEELFEVVNSANQTIGIQKPRWFVHENRLWHRTVHVYVIDTHGRFLIHKRSEHKDVSPGLWDARIGGHIIAGHTAIDTAVREFVEELGYTITYRSLLKGSMRQSNTKKTHRQFAQIFYYFFTGSQEDFHFADDEIQKAEFVAPWRIVWKMFRQPADWSGGGHWEFIRVWLGWVMKGRSRKYIASEFRPELEWE